MRQAVRIALLGDFDPEARSHWATEAALFHAASWLGFDAEPRWFPTEILESPDAQDRLAHFDGVWAVPGSPYRSFNGMLRGIEFARRRDLPYLGTCAGFQYALIEFSRNVRESLEFHEYRDHSRRLPSSKGQAGRAQNERRRRRSPSEGYAGA